MPVTARLSRKFYDQFGDDIVNELVDWFNTVDDTYRAELRELNEMNHARSDARLEMRLAELGGAIRAEVSELGASLRREIAEQYSSIRSEIAELRAEIRVELHQKLGEQKADLMRWTFGLWATQMAATIALFVALIKFVA